MRLVSREHPRRALSRFPAHDLGLPRAPRLQNTGTGDVAIESYVYYDIYFVAPGNPMPTATAFATQKGSQYNLGGVTAFNKTSCHTNLKQAGKLNSSDSFAVKALSFIVFAQQGIAHPNLHPEDLNNLLMSYCYLEVDDLKYFEGISAWLPGGGGPVGHGFGTLTAPASAFTNTNGLPSAQNIYEIPEGLEIDPQQTFDFTIDPTQSALAAGGTGAPSTLAAAGNPTGVPASGIGAWIRMEGQRVRQVQ